VNFYIYCRQNGLWPKEVAGFDALKDRKKLIAYSPDRLVKPGYPPTLLLHGDRDTDVPFQLSEQMAAALQHQHIEHSLYRMSGFNHLFDVFPNGLPPAGKPIGLQNPQAAAAFQQHCCSSPSILAPKFRTDDVLTFKRDHRFDSCQATSAVSTALQAEVNVDRIAAAERC